jgi:hypothetical protein
LQQLGGLGSVQVERRADDEVERPPGRPLKYANGQQCGARAEKESSGKLGGVRPGRRR